MQLSFLSLTTSISYSFQPPRNLSMKISEVGDNSSPLLQISSNSSLLYAIPPPDPPIVKLGLNTQGKPILSKRIFASSKLWASPDSGTFNPILSIEAANNSLSSALSIASFVAPIISTLCFLRIPLLSRSRAALRAVCPPMVGNSASGFSFSMIFSIVSQ